MQIIVSSVHEHHELSKGIMSSMTHDEFNREAQHEFCPCHCDLYWHTMGSMRCSVSQHWELWPQYRWIMNSIQNIMRFSQVYAELHTDVLTAGTDAYDYHKMNYVLHAKSYDLYTGSTWAPYRASWALPRTLGILHMLLCVLYKSSWHQ